MLLLASIFAITSEAETRWGNEPIYLYVDSAKIWSVGRIFANNQYIAHGTTPTFSYGKDRIAYLDSAYHIIISDGFDFDTLIQLPFRQYRLTLSWDSAGALYFAQELRMLRLDTANRKIDTVFTFKDSAFIKSHNSGVAFKWQLCEGNVVDGRYAAFTLNRGDNNFNTIWYCDFLKDSCKSMMSRAAACQSALTYDNQFVAGTYYGHRYLSLYPITPQPDTTLYDSTDIWEIRFFKFAPELVSWTSTYSDTSTIMNYQTKTVVAALSGRRLYDYIPAKQNSKAESRPMPKLIGNSVLKYYAINGRIVKSGFPKTPGVYIQSGLHPRKVLILP